MRWIVTWIKPIMIIAGLLTCTMLYALFAPQAALQSNFGQVLEGPAAEIVVRNWGALVGLVGLMLLYGAVTPSARRLVLAVAGASKLVFIGLVLQFGRQFLGHGVGVAVLVDGVWVLVFAVYLLATPDPRAAG